MNKHFIDVTYAFEVCKSLH